MRPKKYHALVCVLLMALAGCQREETLFRLLDKARTGIDFKNTITDSEQLNAMTFEYIYNGAGVATADFNNDGLTDLYFTGNQVSSRLYLNKGKMVFEDMTGDSYTETKGWCTGVTTVDINQDGWQDIYVCVAGLVNDTTQRANLLFENQGAGADGIPIFKEKAAQYGLNDMGYSTQAAFFDYDRDGDLDCYVLTNALEKDNRNALRPKRTNGQAPSNDRLYRNDGLPNNNKIRKFTNVTAQAGIQTEGYGLGMTVSDLNGDGWEDVYCANDFLSNDLVWINNQKGGFVNRAAQYLKHQTHNSMGVDVADINNDTRPDVMVLDMLPETNERQKMMLGGSNHDRLQLDLKLGYQPQFMRNTLQLNQGTNQSDSGATTRFSEISQLAGVDKTDWSWAPLFADYDNDGQQDLLITNGYRRDVTNLDFTVYLASQRSYQMFNEKAKDEAAVFKKLKELPDIKLANYAYRNRGDLTFENVTKKWGLNTPSYSNGAVYCDLDNDGDLDYVVNNIDEAAFCYENTANQNPENHWLNIKLTGSIQNRDAVGTKLKLYAGGRVQFRECQPTRGYASAVGLTQYFGLGKTTQIDSLVLVWPDGNCQTELKMGVNQTNKISYAPQRVRPTTYAFDAQPQQKTFVGINPKSIGLDFVHLENDFNDFNQTPVLPCKLSRVSPCLAVGDVNRDGLDDFFVGTDAGQPSQLFIQKTDGTFKQTALAKTDRFENAAALFFDADRDGDADLYIVSGGSHGANQPRLYQDRLYLNDGKGGFDWQKTALPPTQCSGSSVAVADFDRDGDLDVFRGSKLAAGGYPLVPGSYLLVNQTAGGQVKFADKTAALAPELLKIGMVTAAAWGDFDQDQYPDLVVTGEWMSPSILQNQGGRILRQKQTMPLCNGLWQSILVKDLDRDGDLDVAVGNIGLNTKYKANPSQPLRMYAKDYDKNGQIDPIMSFYLGNDEVPVASRDLLMLQLPGLKRYFQTYNAYAKATMGDVLDNKNLENAYTANITELRSGWLKNNGGTGFEFVAFPTEAQFSVVNAMAVWGHDLVLVGNSKAPETIGGWWDASVGTLLSATNKGTFDVQKNSGLLADHEARATLFLKQKNGYLLIIANVEGPLQVFRKANYQKL